MKPRAEIKTVTRQLIDGLLSINTDNRNIRRRGVELYENEIKSGRWHLTNQGIGVSEDGVLIDGQHRLLAIKNCGYPQIDILVVYGLSRESRLAVDQHAKRSARDLMQFSFNAKVSRSAPAIARTIYKERYNWGVGAISIGQLMDQVIEYQYEIDSVVNHENIENFFTAPVLAAAVMMIKETGKTQEVLDFMDRVKAGEMLKRDQPEYHLRTLVLSSNNGGGNIQKEFFEKTVRAITASLEGQNLSKLYARKS